MKNYLLPIFALLIAGCGNQPNTKEWPIKPTNEVAARLIELDSISRAILGDTSKTQEKSLNYWKAMISIQRLCNRCGILRI